MRYLKHFDERYFTVSSKFKIHDPVVVKEMEEEVTQRIKILTVLASLLHTLFIWDFHDRV